MLIGFKFETVQPIPNQPLNSEANETNVEWNKSAAMFILNIFIRKIWNISLP